MDLSSIKDEYAKTGRPKPDVGSLICSFIVMKCEGFSMITDLLDYLDNNLKIAYYCGFDIMRPLPSYAVFGKFIKSFDNELLKELMESQVLELGKLGIIDSSFVSLDSLPLRQILHKTTRSHLRGINLLSQTSRKRIRVADLEFKQQAIGVTRRSASFIGVIKIIS